MSEMKNVTFSLKLMQSFYSLSWHEEWRTEVGQRVFWQKFGPKESWDVSSFYLDGVPPALNHSVRQTVSQSASWWGSYWVHSVSVDQSVQPLTFSHSANQTIELGRQSVSQLARLLAKSACDYWLLSLEISHSTMSHWVRWLFVDMPDIQNQLLS